MRPVLWVVALFALGSCDFGGGSGPTCGRGRCKPHRSCVSVFGEGRQNQGWRDDEYPNVDNEWWCVGPCPSGKACPGMCLEDPADENVVACAGDQVELVYRSVGTSCLCDRAASRCLAGQPVTGVEVTDTCSAQNRVTLMTCPANVDCPAGTFLAGDPVPGVRLFFGDTNLEFLHCPGLPSSTFGPWLPAGHRVRAFVDVDTCF